MVRDMRLQFGNDGRPMAVPTARDAPGVRGRRRPSWGHSDAINRLAEPKQHYDDSYNDGYGDARAVHPKAWGAGGGGRRAHGGNGGVATRGRGRTA